MKRLVLLAVCAVAAVGNATAAPAAQTSAYVGQETRDIKALSADEVQAYLSGKGMGLAKAAELNGYPGPAHVLALAAELSLTPEQRQQTEALFAAMEANAIGAGSPLVDEERRLDRMFASKTITPELLSAALARIGELQAKVRAAHLEAHVAQLRILTPEQAARYMQLRGYGSDQQMPGHGHHHQ